MPFIPQLILMLILVGFALWVITLIPMDATIKQVVKGLILLLVLLWVLSLFFPGMFAWMPRR